jgi:hypothetical protein
MLWADGMITETAFGIGRTTAVLRRRALDQQVANAPPLT